MRALTIRQPWADAIVHGEKRIENRTWTTAHTGPILIHAGSAYDPVARLIITDWTALNSWPDARGAVIGVAQLNGHHHAADACCAPWGEPTSVHWELSDVRPLPKPVPAKGRLGLWRPSDDLLNAVRRQLTTTR